MVNDGELTCYFIKYCFSGISFDFQFAYTTHLFFLKKCLIMKLLIMGIYFSFENSSFEMKAPKYTIIS